MELFLIGVILAISGNSLIAIALTLQKHAHNIEKKTGEPAVAFFWMSIAGMIGGEIGNFAAFGFASPTVVSPLGAVAVIANGLLASLVLATPAHAARDSDDERPLPYEDEGPAAADRLLAPPGEHPGVANFMNGQPGLFAARL